MLLAWKSHSCFFYPEGAFPPPSHLTSFPPAAVGRTSAKVGTRPRQQMAAPLFLGFHKISQQGTSPSRTSPLQCRDSPDELIMGALRILGPDLHLCVGYSYCYCLNLEDKPLVPQKTSSSAATAFTARGGQLLSPKGRKGIRALSIQQPRLPVPAEGTSRKETALQEEHGKH